MNIKMKSKALIILLVFFFSIRVLGENLENEGIETDSYSNQALQDLPIDKLRSITKKVMAESVVSNESKETYFSLLPHLPRERIIPMYIKLVRANNLSKSVADKTDESASLDDILERLMLRNKIEVFSIENYNTENRLSAFKENFIYNLENSNDPPDAFVKILPLLKKIDLPFDKDEEEYVELFVKANELMKDKSRNGAHSAKDYDTNDKLISLKNDFIFNLKKVKKSPRIINKYESLLSEISIPYSDYEKSMISDIVFANNQLKKLIVSNE